MACIKTDGTLWMWGDGGEGALGQNLTSGDRSSPVQVGSSTTWTAVAAGGSWCLAVDAGKLFAWGKNTSSGTDSGILGLNDLISRSSPTQVGSLTNWAKPATNVRSLGFSLCTKTDGTLWSWGFAGADAIYGRTNYGNLGLNDNNPRSSPTQVGSLTNWALPSAGAGFSICTKTDGTLWTWGRNAQGQLGLGDYTNRSSPVQVGALTTWVTPTADNKSAACIKTDGTLWTWGYNGQGQLGRGGAANSPVQVGSLTGWQTVNGGYDHMVAIRRK
jgi:alpha-tubulin suppressor-like RCC1 family protein